MAALLSIHGEVIFEVTIKGKKRPGLEVWFSMKEPGMNGETGQSLYRFYGRHGSPVAGSDAGDKKKGLKYESTEHEVKKATDAAIKTYAPLSNGIRMIGFKPDEDTYSPFSMDYEQKHDTFVMNKNAHVFNYIANSSKNPFSVNVNIVRQSKVATTEPGVLTLTPMFSPTKAADTKSKEGASGLIELIDQKTAWKYIDMFGDWKREYQNDQEE